MKPFPSENRIEELQQRCSLCAELCFSIDIGTNRPDLHSDWWKLEKAFGNWRLVSWPLACGWAVEFWFGVKMKLKTSSREIGWKHFRIFLGRCCYLCSARIKSLPMPWACKYCGFHTLDKNKSNSTLQLELFWVCCLLLVTLWCHNSKKTPPSAAVQVLGNRFCQWKLNFQHGSQIWAWSSQFPDVLFVLCHHLAFYLKKPTPTFLFTLLFLLVFQASRADLSKDVDAGKGKESIPLCPNAVR